jgi:hypothetical protein
MRAFGRFRTITAALAFTVVILAGSASAALAIPPGGAGADTPGTSSKVSPRKVAPGGRIDFTVSGFPAGETVYNKINDGLLCADTSQGACVYHSQRVPKSGTASGYLRLPGDLADGDYWLRFLASEYIDPDDPGKGTKGYTRKSQTFTVSGAATGGATDSSKPMKRGEAPTSGKATTGTQGVVKAPEIQPASTPKKVPAAPADAAAGLDATKAGGIEATVADARVDLTLGLDYAGEWAYVYAYPGVVGLGWQQVDANGRVSVTAADLAPGKYQLAAVDVDAKLLGWIAVELPDAAASSGSAAPVATASDPSESASAAQPSSGSAPVPAPGFPVLGTVALAVALLATAGAVAAVLLRRRRSATTATKSSTDVPANEPESAVSGEAGSVVSRVADPIGSKGVGSVRMEGAGQGVPEWDEPTGLKATGFVPPEGDQG